MKRYLKYLGAVLLACALLAWWWWPSIGAEAKGFPGNRTVSSFFSQATGGRALPDFIGSPARAQPLPPLPMPRHPFHNNFGYAGAHGDSYNSGTLPGAGPLGHQPKVFSRMTGALPSLCSTQHFDARGRIVTVCSGLFSRSRLLLLDGKTLKILAAHDLPKFTGFYIRFDQHGRVMVPVGDMSLQMFDVVEGPDGPRWRLVARHDLRGVLTAAELADNPFPMDIVYDWQGNLWFAIAKPAVVGFVDRAGNIHARRFGSELIENGLAADPNGVYLVTDKKFYGYRAAGNGVATFLQFPYDAGKGAYSMSRGSGTTPTVFAGNLVAFADNADPRPNVLVYRIDDVPNDKRLVCKIPVFKPGRTVLENSFIGYDHSLVIENNMGFSLLNGSSRGEPGLERIDVRRDLSGCDKVWENYDVRAGTGAKLSTASGLIYVHEPLMNTGWVTAWYVTAIDFRSGQPVWRKYVGSGKQWDNAMLTMSIGPDGTLTSGMLTGLLALRDEP